MKIEKIIIGITLLLLVMGVVGATGMVDIFKAPSPLKPFGNSAFADGQGHNILIIEYDGGSHEVWLENDTDYSVEPYKNNNSFYFYVDASDVDPDGIEEVGIIEIVEKDGKQYIITSSTPNNDEDSNPEIIFNNLLEFNKLNQLTPILL